MNNSESLTQTLLAQLQGAPMQKLAQQLGADAGQTQNAVSAALPLLFGALGQNAQQGGGASIMNALQRDHGGSGDVGSLLGSLLGGAGSGKQDGAAILGHIFGAGKQRQVESGLGQATGLGGQASDLLKLLAPIVMAFLAQRVQSSHLNADDLGRTLNTEKQQAQQQGGHVGGLLGSLLDQDGDGKVGLTDLMKIGGSLLGGKR
ncbi:MAG: DUF937 domain-containing protein [Alcaligenaceae bacterium]|nr:DUF937 domain-containing protein [Alcaligenaceae bacterium]